MNFHGTKDLESLKHEGEDISGSKCSMIQAEDSLSEFSLHQGQDRDAKADCQRDELEESHAELTQATTKIQAERRDSMCQNFAKTEELDPSCSPHAGHSTYENSSMQSHCMPNPARMDERLPQCMEECNSEKVDPTIQQMSRAKEFNSSLANNDMQAIVPGQQTSNVNISVSTSPQSIAADNNQKGDLDSMKHKGEYFYYDTPLYEETGIWIPVSVPPMTENEHGEWTKGFCPNGGYIPEEDMGWSQCISEDKELTMWDVVVEMLLTARGKATALASGDISQISWISNHLIERAWKEMAQTLTEASFSNAQEILESEPPTWLPDSAASSCMLCSVRFHPITCSRHHCRFCGGIFCSGCTKGRSLLPEKFHAENPQRVCDVCCVRLESVEPYLMDQVSRAAQLPTHDLTDLSTLRSWINFPWGQSMEYEIYKATNTIRSYAKVASLGSEKRIPEAILRDAKGLAIVTVVRVGMMFTYNVGTGLVLACREDGSWSPPSAISSFGVGWGAQAGGELTDFIIVLRTHDAVKTFCSDAHFSIGAGLSAAVGVMGRTAEADMRVGGSGFAACYTYSLSKGAFIGCSLEGSIVTTCASENSRFYGSQSLNASEILLGSLPRPPAAATLYRALGDLFLQLERGTHTR